MAFTGITLPLEYLQHAVHHPWATCS